MHLKKITALTLMALLTASAAFAQFFNDPSIKGSASVNLAKAEIEKVNPLNVLPGTLVVIEGFDFGTTPGVIKVGTTTIDTFLGWEDTAIFFRAPADIGNGGVTVGSSTGEFRLKSANAADSVTVYFAVDTSKPNLNEMSADQKSTLNNKVPAFTGPLFVKGEWKKTSEEEWGNKDAVWDGGSKYRMLKVSGTTWIAEAVFTGENVDTFRNKRNPNVIPGAKFAFEDSNMDRNLVEFESDWAFVLKRSFQKTSGATGNDPVAYLTTSGNKSGWYDSGRKRIVAAFPVSKKP